MSRTTSTTTILRREVYLPAETDMDPLTNELIYTIQDLWHMSPGLSLDEFHHIMTNAQNFNYPAFIENQIGIDIDVDIDPEWAASVLEAYGERTSEAPPCKRLKRTEIKECTAEHRYSKHLFQPQDRVSINGKPGTVLSLKRNGKRTQVLMDGAQQQKVTVDTTQVTAIGPDKQTSCVICMDDFVSNNVLTTLPCKHSFHKKCIGTWLTKGKASCPICNYSFSLDSD